MSTVTNLTPYRPDWHIDREDEQQLFVRELRFKGGGKRSIVFQGEGGIGKSWLYDWCWRNVRETPGDRFYAQVNLDSRNDVVGWLEDIRISFGACGDAADEFGWGFGGFPRFDFALALYSAARGGGDYVSPKFRRLIAAQPGVEALVDSTIATGTSIALKAFFQNEPFSVSLGAIVKPLLSLANVWLDKRGIKSLDDDCTDITQYNADSIVAVLPRLLAKDLNDLCAGQGGHRFALLIDGYERLLNSTAVRGGLNNTGWLSNLHEHLDCASVFIFSRYQIQWLIRDTADSPFGKQTDTAGDDEDDMFAPFLAPKTFSTQTPHIEDQFVQHHRIPLFTRRQAIEYLLKRNIRKDSLGFEEIVDATRLPWELDLTARYLKVNPLNTQGEREAFANSHMLERMLEARPDGEKDLIRVMCFAKSFTERSVYWIAEALGYGQNSATVSQFMASSLVVPMPDLTDRFRIDHHFGDRLRNPTPDIARRFGLARRGDKLGAERLSKATALLTGALVDDLQSSRYGLQDKIALLNDAIAYPASFRPRFANVWSPKALSELAAEVKDSAREALLSGYRSEAQKLSEEYESLYLTILELVSSDPTGAADEFRPIALAWGVRFVELELEILARFSDDISRNAFVTKVQKWQDLLRDGATSKAGPFASLERYWYARLECRAHEFALEMRTRAAATQNYYRRLGSSFRGHTAALNVIRQSGPPGNLSEKENEEHLQFLSQSLLWNANRNRSRPEIARDLYREASGILHQLASQPVNGKRFAEQYARALVNIPYHSKKWSKEREAQLEGAVAALAQGTNVHDFAYLETLEKACSRLAELVGLHEENEGTNASPAKRIIALAHDNVTPIAEWIESVEIPPVPFAHLLLKSIRKSSELLGTHFDNTAFTPSIRKSLKALALSSPELARSGYHELERIQNLKTFNPVDLRRWLEEAVPELTPFSGSAVDSLYQISLACYAEFENDATVFQAAIEKLYSAEVALNSLIVGNHNVPGYLQDHIRNVGKLLMRLLCQDKAMRLETAQRIAEVIERLSKRGEFGTGKQAVKTIREGFESLAWPRASRAMLARTLVHYLPQWGVDNYNDYVFFLRQQASTDVHLSWSQRERNLSKANEIESFLDLDIFVGSRLAAAKAAYDTDEVDDAIRLIFGAFTQVENFEKDNVLRSAVRKLWAELVWKKASDLNASARGEYRSAAKVPLEVLEKFGTGDKTSFPEDVLDLFASIPRALKPSPKELLVGTFDHRSDGLIEFGEEGTDYAFLGKWEDRRLVCRLSLLPPKDEMALRPTESAPIDATPSNQNSRSVLVGADFNVANFAPIKPMRRLALVTTNKVGGVNVTCRGPYLLKTALQAIAPKAIPIDNPRCRIAPDPFSRAICVVTTEDFLDDAMRCGAWFRYALRDLLGVHLLQFMQASTQHGDFAVETEIKSFLKGYSHFRLTALMPSEATFQLVPGKTAELSQARNFARLFASVFPGLRARVEGYEEREERSDDLFGFSADDLRLALEMTRNFVPSPDVAEVLKTKYERGKLWSARIRTFASGTEFRLAKDVLHGSGLNLREGQVVHCRFGWNGRQVEIAGIERKLRPDQVPMAVKVDRLDPEGSVCFVLPDNGTQELLRLPLSLLREQGRIPTLGDRLEVVTGIGRDVIFVVPQSTLGPRQRDERETNGFKVVRSGGMLSDCVLQETHSERTVKISGKRLLKFGVMLLREGDRVRGTVSWNAEEGVLHSVIDVSRPNLRNVPGRIVDSGSFFQFTRHGEEVKARFLPRVRGEPVLNGVSATAHMIFGDDSQFAVMEIVSIDRRGGGRWYEGQLTLRGKFLRFISDEDAVDALVPFFVLKRLSDGIDQEININQIQNLAVRARLAETDRGVLATDLDIPECDSEEHVVATIDTVNHERGFMYLTLESSGEKLPFSGVYLTPAEALIHGIEYPIAGRRFSCAIKLLSDRPVVRTIKSLPGDVIKQAELHVASLYTQKGSIELLYGSTLITVTQRSDVLSEIARPLGRRLRGTLVRVRGDYIVYDATRVPDSDLSWVRAVIKERTEKGLVLQHILSGKTEFVHNVVLKLFGKSEIEKGTMIEISGSVVGGRNRITDLRVRDQEELWLSTAVVESFDQKAGCGNAKILGHDLAIGFQCAKRDPLSAVIARNMFIDVDLWSHRGKLSARSVRPTDTSVLPWRPATIAHIESGFAIARLNSEQTKIGQLPDSVYISSKVIRNFGLADLQSGNLVYLRVLPGLEAERLTAVSAVYPVSEHWDGQLGDNERLEVLVCEEDLPGRNMKILRSLEQPVAVKAYEESFDAGDWKRMEPGQIVLGRVSERGWSHMLREIVDFMGNGIPIKREKVEEIALA